MLCLPMSAHWNQRWKVTPSHKRHKLLPSLIFSNFGGQENYDVGQAQHRQDVSFC
eukprot:00961.XXX_575_793_1 [CDS] Oithona nana genome sequencing.